jgi:hypothetical protein
MASQSLLSKNCQIWTSLVQTGQSRLGCGFDSFLFLDFFLQAAAERKRRLGFMAVAEEGGG